ncbi:secretory carrier-associated membrane protein 4 [Tanacetum coccineum]
MTGTEFDIEKFDEKNDFGLWQVRMKALLEHQGLAAGGSQSEYIDEFHKLVGDLAAIDTARSDEDQAFLLLTSLPSSYDNLVETLLYGHDTLKLEDVLATLNSRELLKITKAKGDGGEGLYVKRRSGQRDMEQGTYSVVKVTEKKQQTRVLWDKKGVETTDIVSGQNFNMRAMVLWTINDFPARSSLSGWSGQGYKACPTCNEETPSIGVKNKIAYVGHRRFLRKPHKWRSSREFNGDTDHRDPPKEYPRDVVQSRDERRTTQNSGICTPGPDGEMSYGQLQEILEFKYLSFKVALFRVKWFDTRNNGRVKKLTFRNGMTQIIGSGEWWKNDQYILALIHYGLSKVLWAKDTTMSTSLVNKVIFDKEKPRCFLDFHVDDYWMTI